MDEIDTLEPGSGDSAGKEEQEKQKHWGRVKDSHGRWVFAPGFSGNPAGRTKTKPITAAMEKLAGELVPKEVLATLGVPGISTDAQVTWAELIARGVAIAAAQGKAESTREFTDRVEGKLPQPVSGSLLVMQMRELFDRMAPEELRAYAEGGTLPSWVRGGNLLLPGGIENEEAEE